MVHRTYVGLGPPERAVGAFEALAPHVAELFALQTECAPHGPDHAALGIALDGVETAAYHFTRRRHFYDRLRAAAPAAQVGNGRLADRREACRAFAALEPYVRALRRLQQQCRPFGRDYLALDIAKQSLETAAFHFTRIEAFYGCKGDGAGTFRPPQDLAP